MNIHSINKENLRKVYKVCVPLYVVFALLVAALSIPKYPGDIYIFTNTSNSMNPTISSGSITIAKKYEWYEPGEIISYYTRSEGKEIIVTHRISRIGGNVYITKGDHNEAVDSENVIPRLIIGKVIFIIPFFGYILSFAKSSVGTLLCIILPAGTIIFIELLKIVKEIQPQKKKKNH